MIQLFRGFDSKTKKWVYGSLIEESRLYGSSYKINVFAKDHEELDVQVHVHPVTIGRFTGKLDIRGKRIFENDYIMFSVNDGKALRKSTKQRLVEYDNEMAGWVCVGALKRKFFIGDPMIVNIEVVGNNHENP